MKLFPLIVTLHLLGGLILLALLQAQAVRYAQAHEATRPVLLSRAAWSLLVASFVLLWLQIALGGWVSTNYAVLACSGFPACNGQTWPAMHWSEGFTLLRELGRAGHGGYLSFEAMVAIHMAHRLFAVVASVVLAWLAWRLWRTAALQRFGQGLALLLLAQLASGLSNVVLGWPLVAALAHSAGAAALVLLLTLLLARTVPAARVATLRAGVAAA